VKPKQNIHPTTPLHASTDQLRASPTERMQR
jgi:hypothetical protein